MGKIFYIGSFPPPYGGATIKNDVLYKELSKHSKISKFNTAGNFDLMKLVKLGLFLLKNINNKGIICIFDISLFKITKVINILNKKMLGRISVFITGGNLRDRLIENNQNIATFNKYKNIYVECTRMKVELEELGLENLKVIPNCRPKPFKREFFSSDDYKHIKCIFMSRICDEKGVKIAVDAGKILNNKNINYTLDFYGSVDSTIERYFIKEVNNNDNIYYKGVFKADKHDVYNLLKGYDLLLFPTKYSGEGFPGILTESKIAGIPVIASDYCYNSEIITNRVDGIILEELTAEKLSDIILELNKDRETLNKLREQSFISGESYFIENYSEYILNNM